jgi:hypothetical protein
MQCSEPCSADLRHPVLVEDDVTKGQVNDERIRVLRRLRRRQFERRRFRGFDALVLRVPEDGSVPLAVRQGFPEGPMRIYPVPGGYLYKWPHPGGDDPPTSFVVEPGGWDHEHCDGCNRHIDVRHAFWQTARGGCFWLCAYCFRQSRQLNRGNRRGS